MKDIKIKIPKNPKKIIETLRTNGYEAYVVGGCVRDSIIGRQPGDWDITTSALPTQVKKLFKKTIDTGLKHGTVTILEGNEPIEVTTYRIDGEYEDNRRPKSVEFTPKLIEDLKRRDFTINAMAYNDTDGLIDPFKGIIDLNNRIIRCVGNPKDRFNEDALRMMRAIRFSAQLDFIIDEATLQAISSCAKLIDNVSQERIQIELNKTLMAQKPSKIMLMYDLHLMNYVLPEFIPCIGNIQNHPYHSYDIGEHTIKAIEYIEPDIALRWTMLLHDIGKPEKKSTDEKGIDHFYGHPQLSYDMSIKILKRLKFDNKTIDRVSKLVLLHDYRFEVTTKSIRKAIRKIGEGFLFDFLKVQEADIKAQNPDLVNERLKKLEEIKKEYSKIKALNQCTSIKELQVNGKNLIDIGIKEGIEIGIILNQLLDLVIEEPKNNNKQFLLDNAVKLNQSLKKL